MGSGISQSAQQELSAFNSFINNFSTNIRNQVSSTCQAGNTLRFTTGGGNGCEFFATGSNININQTSQATCSLTSENITTITMNIENDLQHPNLTRLLTNPVQHFAFEIYIVQDGFEDHFLYSQL
jgi:hypothetical protein